VKRGTLKHQRVDDRAAKRRATQRPSRVQRGRTTLLTKLGTATGITRWSPAYPWDGRQIGTGLVDTSQLACECGECPGCQSRVG